MSGAALTDNGNEYKVVVSNGVSTNVTSSTAALFVGPLGQVPDLCDTNWSAVGTRLCSRVASISSRRRAGQQHGEIVWPTLIATDNIVLSFTVTLSNPSSTPADGFTVVLGDPSLGATPTSTGATGFGLGAQGFRGSCLDSIRITTQAIRRCRMWRWDAARRICLRIRGSW